MSPNRCFKVYALYSCNNGVFYGMRVCENEKKAGSITIAQVLSCLAGQHRSKGMHQKLAKEIAMVGTNRFMLTVDPTNYKSRGEAYEKIREYQLAADKYTLLNDYVMSNEMTYCWACGKEVRVVFKDLHDGKYCNMSRLKSTDNSTHA